MANGRWRDPGLEGWSRVAPWLCPPDDEVELLATVEAMAREASGFEGLCGPGWRTSMPGANPERRNAPAWIDAEKAVLIAVNKSLGSDLGVVLDMRADGPNPRVLASVYVDAHPLTETESRSLQDGDVHLWREVSPTLRAFLQRVGLLD